MDQAQSSPSSAGLVSVAEAAVVTECRTEVGRKATGFAKMVETRASVSVAHMQNVSKPLMMTGRE